ncbi:PA2817 family protein [Motiliproteus sediminis]|uniref:PA2817 family protein n=1 Tax=Motiliproteus sediminis TaxID=1468178 RepID=UPI001AEF7981|nr:PA2817 family protein [Motiliproteus sediminis]
MSNASDYRAFHLNLLKASFNRLLKQPPFTNKDAIQDDLDFLEQLVLLVKALEAEQDDATYLGQDLICRLIRAYPQHTHLIDRDLLWFFGGDCLHYMPDEEIAKFQELDEMRFAAEDNNVPFSYENARARVFKLH